MLSADRLIQRAAALYSLPGVAVQVLHYTAQPQVELRSLRQCLETDPALAGKVLRVVNSSLFGLTRPVSDLGQALTLLGVKPLKLLVLGFSLPDQLFVGVAGPLLQRYWQRTLTTAVAARELAEHIWQQPGDEAFLAGLLGDVGMLLLLQELGESYAQLLRRAFDSGGNLLAAEREALDFDHRQLGVLLLKRWGLPDSLTDAISAEPTVGPPLDSLADRALPQILHLARLLNELLETKSRAALDELLSAGRAFREIQPQQFAAVLAALQAKVESLADLLAIEFPDGLNYADVMRQAQTQLAAVSQEAATELLDRSFLQFNPPVKPTVEPTPKPGAAKVATSAEIARPGNRRCVATATYDPGLLAAISAAAETCRESRCGLSLMLIELNDYSSLLSRWGLEQAEQIVGRLKSLCQSLDLVRTTCQQTGESQFAVVLPHCERRQAVELANQLLSELRQTKPAQMTAVPPTISASIGLAAMRLPPKNFAAEKLFDGAERCLFGAKLSGRNTLKSIEIY